VVIPTHFLELLYETRKSKKEKMIALYLLFMAPVVTFLFVVLKEDHNTMREYRDMKNKVDEKTNKIKRLFDN
jgi:hypothetical protein